MRLNSRRLGLLAPLALWLTLTTLSFGDERGRSDQREQPVPAGCRQLLLVRSANWVTSAARLQRYERTRGSSWRAVGEPLQVNVGRHGMAWGRGLQRPESGPSKREGDGRTPAGIFRLGTLFGYADQAPTSASPNFSYVHIRAGTECVEDPRSPAYNSIIASSRMSPMLRADGVFRLGFVIEQNAPTVVPGAGSCVFFHVQRGPSQATSGCTSTSLENLRSVVSWLEPESEPVIVQLPESEYTRLKDDWALP